MRFQRHLKLEYGLAQIEIVPLFNVLLLMLIFFLLTSSLLLQGAIKIGLPEAITSDMVKYENLELSISAENLASIKGRILSSQELQNLFVAAAKRRQALLIKADKRASLGKVVEIWEKARDAGIQGLSIATSQE
jgi:biopolymer transport protein ExbD